MQKFKSGDLCIIVDIKEGDAYFPQKEELIGRRVEFRWYSTSPNHREQDGFLSCMAYICDEYEEGSIRKAICFWRVKLKKVV
jgi:hypothetical protein